MLGSCWVMVLLIVGLILGACDGLTLALERSDEESLSVRAQGMGGILPLSVRDPSVLFFNPAGLGGLEGIGLSIEGYSSSTSLWPGLTTTLNMGPLGISRFRNKNRITHKVGYGFRPLSWFSWGLSFDIDDEDNAMDVGIIVSPRPWLDIGICQKGLVETDKKPRSKQIISLTSRWGKGKNLLTLGGILQEDDLEFRLGLEHRISNRSALRVGYKDDHLTLGGTLGLFSLLDLDYAAELGRNGNITHYLGLTFDRPRYFFYENDINRVVEKAEFGQDRFASVNGYNVHYVECGSGSPIILITGSAATYRIWNRLIPSLSRFYRVLAIETLGNGDSDKPSFGFNYSYTEHANFIKEFMEKLGIEEANLVGICYGGTIALQFVKMYPDLTGKVIVIDGFLDTEDLVRDQWLLFYLRAMPIIGDLYTGLLHSGALDGLLAKLVIGDSYSRMNKNDKKTVIEIIHWNNVNASRFFWENLMKVDPDNLKVRYEGTRIKSPILFLTGENSFYKRYLSSTLEVLERTVENLEVVTVKDAVHNLHLQDPQQCSRLILQFLNRP